MLCLVLRGAICAFPVSLGRSNKHLQLSLKCFPIAAPFISSISRAGCGCCWFRDLCELVCSAFDAHFWKLGLPGLMGMDRVQYLGS